YVLFGHGKGTPEEAAVERQPTPDYSEAAENIEKPAEEKPETSEITALGAAYLAGLGIGLWDDVEQIKRQWNVKTEFEPNGDFNVKEHVGQWHRAINTTSYWSNNK
ncbi:MAG: hypothetical protein DSY83_00150, partial [Flavobacteriia bacterium]